MSAGARLRLADALAAAECIRGMWGLDAPACALVGSARRETITVGDLEFIAPMPEAIANDDLFDRMDRTMQTEGLFGAGTVPLARPLKGFRRGFLYCDTLVDLTNQATGEGLSVRVQIHRYAADGSNRGWIQLMRTGPAEFGEWFLRQWKSRHAIPPDQRASIDGHLVGPHGGRIPTPSEADCFVECGMKYVEPDRRDGIAEVMKAQHRHERGWATR